MKPVPHPILAVAALVGILLLSVTMPAKEASKDRKNPPTSTLLEFPDIEEEPERSIPSEARSAQFPFLTPE
jgi:hypothetical protein